MNFLIITFPLSAQFFIRMLNVFQTPVLAEISAGVRFSSNFNFNFDDRPVSEFKGSQQNFDAIKCNNMLLIFFKEKKKMIKVECLRKFRRNIFNLRKLFWSLMYHSYDLSNLSLGIFNPHSYSVCIGDLTQQLLGCHSSGFNFFTKARFVSL